MYSCLIRGFTHVQSLSNCEHFSRCWTNTVGQSKFLQIWNIFLERGRLCLPTIGRSAWINSLRRYSRFCFWQNANLIKSLILFSTNTSTICSGKKTNWPPRCGWVGPGWVAGALYRKPSAQQKPDHASASPCGKFHHALLLKRMWSKHIYILNRTASNLWQNSFSTGLVWELLLLQWRSS